MRYPLVESLTGAVFLGSFIAVGAKPAVLFAWFLTALVITMLFIEHDTGMIPDRLVVPATVCALAGAVALDVHHWWYYVAGCVGSGAFALLLALSIPRAARFGDAKMAIFLGAALGPYAAIALPIMLVLRLLAAIALVFGRKGRLRAKTLLIPISTDRDVARRMEVLQENAAKVDAEVMTWL